MAGLAKAQRQWRQLAQHGSQTLGNHRARLGRIAGREADAFVPPSTFEAVNTAAAEHPVRARLGAWPHEPDVAHLVLLDHHMQPTAQHVADWIAQARARGARSVRTGALFAPSTPAFTAAGFEPIDTLRLLELDLDRWQPSADTSQRHRLRRLRPSMLHDAATVDQLAFSAPWANTASALADIVAATPQARARCVHLDGEMVAFSICGRASRWGYVQRLAVHPDARRRGLAAQLLDDALRWMRKRDVQRVLVNTATDNAAALALYRTNGFQDQTDDLLILEHALEPSEPSHPDQPSQDR
jgi:ribosomal protein S18 acetylase RimI-like enzyme